MWSLRPGGMDIIFDRTIVLQHSIFILLYSSGFWGLVLALIGIKGFWFDLSSQYPFNIVLASTTNIGHSRLDCRVLAGWYAWSKLTSRDFTLLNIEDFLSTEHGHGKLFGESLSEWLSGCCQSCRQWAVVRGHLSEWLLSELLLSESFCQRASVGVVAVASLLSKGCCQSNRCQGTTVRQHLSGWLL